MIKNIYNNICPTGTTQINCDKFKEVKKYWYLENRGWRKMQCK